MTKKILALVSAFLVGGIGIAVTGLLPQVAEAGVKLN